MTWGLGFLKMHIAREVEVSGDKQRRIKDLEARFATATARHDKALANVQNVYEHVTAGALAEFSRGRRR